MNSPIHIPCQSCGAEATVYHMNWEAIQCNCCFADIPISHAKTFTPVATCQSEWVPVSERLPSHSCEVLGRNTDYFPHDNLKFHYDVKTDCFLLNPFNESTSCLEAGLPVVLTHWLQIPDLPRDSNE